MNPELKALLDALSTKIVELSEDHDDAIWTLEVCVEVIEENISNMLED